jgi:3-oxoacid CoA-transferase subunit A
MPITYFIIRGNHEERPSICMEKNPDEWHTEMYFRNTVYVENKYPSIKYAMDEPTLYQIPHLSDDSDGTHIYKYFLTLVIPGAYSVDKDYRLQNGWNWFEYEQLTKEEMDKVWTLVDFLNAIGGCDLILSHTCPCIFEPTDLFLPFIDQSMVDRTMERYLGQIEFALNYKAWLWGHYHEFRDYPRTDNKKKTMLFNDCAINLVDYMFSDIKDGVNIL